MIEMCDSHWFGQKNNYNQTGHILMFVEKSI